MANFPKSAFTFTGANASIDTRLFGPYGTLSQTAILGSTPPGPIPTRRA
jgi:hypothetical protein